MDPLHHPGLSPPSGQLAPPLAIKQQTGRQQTLSLTNRGPEINRKRGRSASAAISGTCLQSHVHSPEKRRRLEANHRLAVLEHVPGTSAFQDGGAVHATCHPETGLVYGKDRPQRCLPNHSSGSSTPPPAILPGTSWRVDTISVDTISVPTIRALHRSLCIFEGNKAPCSVLTSAGNLSNHLFRRSTNSIPRKATAIRRPLNSVLAVHSSGVPDQPAQEYNRANPEYRVPWFCNRFSSDDSDSSSPQGGINPKGGIPDSDIGDCTDQDIGTPDWNSGSHEASNTTSPAPLPQSPGSKGPDSAVPQGFLPHHCPLVIGSTERSPVVGNSVAHSLLQQYCEDRSLCSDRIRCIQIRLGSHMPGSEHQGQVDCRGSSITYQLSRANSSIPGTTVFHQRSEQCGCADTDGQSDSNSSAIAQINKMGGPTLSPLCCLALEIWEWCQARNITPHAEYLPGVDNVSADWESRHHMDSSDWQLLPSVFQSLNSQLGSFSVDLFSSRTNAQLPRYYSWKSDPAAIAVDAFSVPWAPEQPYLFPPFNLIGRARGWIV